MFNNSYLSLSEAAKQAPGRPPAATIWRWCRKGIKSRSGEQIKLSHVRAGGRIFIESDSLDDFFRRVADSDAPHFADDSKPIAETKPPSSKRKEKSVAAAKKVLAKAGI